jgi:hypothetical protein
MSIEKFNVCEIKEIYKQYSSEEISFSRMVELINELHYKKMLSDIDNVFDRYKSIPHKEGGYCKLLRNLQTELKNKV